jgi:hypothetical protein
LKLLDSLESIGFRIRLWTETLHKAVGLRIRPWTETLSETVGFAHPPRGTEVTKCVFAKLGRKGKGAMN